MDESTFDQTKAYVDKNSESVKKTGFLITNDPTTGKKVANKIFVSGDDIWIIDRTLMNSHFKSTYLVEHATTGERSVLGITKSVVPRKTPELAVADRLMNLHITGVCEVLDLFNLNTGQKAIMYRYYNGGDLHRRIDSNALTDRDRLVIADCLIKAVAELHHHGIFHRDIKPANVLLQVDADNNVTKAVLSDFGEGTIMDNPQSIRNIEHYHSAPEGNALMHKHKKVLTAWYKTEKERKRYEDKGERIPDELKQREMITEKNVEPLAIELKNVTTKDTYDSWSLGLCLWCLFTNTTSNSFPWCEDVQKNRYGEIDELKKQFIHSNPTKNIPDPYKGIVAQLLEYDREKRLTAKRAMSFLE